MIIYVAEMSTCGIFCIDQHMVAIFETTLILVDVVDTLMFVTC